MKQPLLQKSSDEAIEKVLGGLREVEAPEGLEQRVLRRVAEAQPQPAWRPVWLAMPGRGRSLAYGLAVAALMVGVVALVAVRKPAQTTSDSAQGLSVAHTAEEGLDASRKKQRQEPIQGSFAALRMTSSLGVGQQKTLRPRVPSGVKRPATQEDAEDAQMRSDTLAASHPAPPMPLTEQERLLRKIAHTGDPQELVALNPELRDRALAQGNAEFMQFFPPPPSANQP